jgi:hypothetical protein
MPPVSPPGKRGTMTLGEPQFVYNPTSLAYRGPLKVTFFTTDSLGKCRRTNR